MEHELVMGPDSRSDEQSAWNARSGRILVRAHDVSKLLLTFASSWQVKFVHVQLERRAEKHTDRAEERRPPTSGGVMQRHKPRIAWVASVRFACR